MKAAVGTSLSLVGVIVAGSAAAMVNAQVLRGGDSAEGSSVPSLAASAPSTTLETTTTTSVAATHVVYRVGDSGVVTVDAAGGALALVSVVPSPGWEVLASGVGPTGELEVRFSSWGVEVRLTATLVDGAIVPMVSSGVLEVISDDDDGVHVTAPPPAPDPVTPPPPPSSAHVEHEDEHEDGEREDDEHEDEHEDEDGHADDD